MRPVRLRRVMRSVREPLRRDVASRGEALQRRRVHFESDFVPDENAARIGSPKTGYALTRTFERLRTRTR